MKNIVKINALITLACITFLNSHAAFAELDKIVAVVNSEVITESELNNEYTNIKNHLQKEQTPYSNEQKLRTQVLNQLIDQSVELQTASKAGIEVNDAELDQAIEGITKRNKMSLAELKENLKNEGLNFAEYRENVRKQMTIDKLLQHEIQPRISVSKQEVDKYLHSYAFEQQNVSEYLIEDIVIRLPEVPSSEQLHKANQQADEITKKLQQGESFESLAVVYSRGDTALQGGSLGWRRLEEIPSVFSEPVKTMQKNDVSNPIRAANGIHIIKLIDVKGQGGRHYIQETRARHILLKTTPRSDDAAIEAQLKKLQQQIKKDEKDFAELAKEYSEDRVSALKGGNLGWIQGDEMVPPFTQAMNQLEIGKISDPVKTQFGWHLIQVLERRNVDDTEDFQRRQIEKMLYQRNFQEQAMNFVQRMRDISYVNILLAENESNPTG